MMNTKLAIMALAVAGLLGPTFAADAMSNKHPKHSSMTHKQMTHKQSSMTTGANMQSSASGGAANPSGQGNVGPGTNNNNGPAPGGR